MSYSFDGVDDELNGIFTTSRALPITLAAYVKITNHPVSLTKIVCLGTTTGSLASSVDIATTATDNQWGCRSTDAVPGGSIANEIENVDNVWAPIVGVITSTTLRDVYAKDITQTGTDTGSRDVGSALNDLSIGRAFGNTNEFLGLIAEVAIWDTALTTAQITSYMTGTPASSIAAANLIGYWPLSASNATQSNLGTDAGGDLTVSGAVFDADHPTISSGATTITPNTAGMAV